MSTANKLGFFVGSAMEAELETSEQRKERSRMYVNGGWPLTDATDVSMSAGTRDALNAAWTYSDESTLTSDGHCPLLADGRGIRLFISHSIALNRRVAYSRSQKLEFSPAWSMRAWTSCGPMSRN